MVDTTECPIRKPSDPTTRDVFYSGYKKRTTLKYEAAICEDSGFLVWVNGPFPGPTHDLTIFRSGLMAELDQHHDVTTIADGTYVGEPDYLITPPRPYRSLTPIELMRHHALSRRRILIENFFARLKSFSAMSDVWRHSHEKHKKCFHILCHILNVEFLLTPLRRHH